LDQQPVWKDHNLKSPSVIELNSTFSPKRASKKSSPRGGNPVSPLYLKPEENFKDYRLPEAGYFQGHSLSEYQGRILKMVNEQRSPKLAGYGLNRSPSKMAVTKRHKSVPWNPPKQK
jgi:hypothetical protein